MHRRGYRLLGSERADTTSTKTVGSGLTRFHFEKVLWAVTCVK
jgi:hypothetical protein